MSNSSDLRCDGCGQVASAEHIARRLRRLEWATRYRPVHIQTLLLGGMAPREDAEFLYAPDGEFQGEAGELLRAVGISPEGRTAEAVYTEFQSAGLFLAHILECPLENSDSSQDQVARMLREHLPAVASRIRRSLKPRRVILVTEVAPGIVQDILSMNLSCPMISNKGMPFRFSSSDEGASFSRFRELLAPAREG